MSEENNPGDLMTNLVKSTMQQAKQIQMEKIVISIGFPLKGHNVVIAGSNPDAVFNAVDVVKKNKKKLEEVKEK